MTDVVDPLEMVIRDLPVSNRAYHAMVRGGIRTVRDLTEWDAWELHDLRGFGENCMKETVNALAHLGLTLKPSNYFNRRLTN